MTFPMTFPNPSVWSSFDYGSYKSHQIDPDLPHAILTVLPILTGELGNSTVLVRCSVEDPNGTVSAERASSEASRAKMEYLVQAAHSAYLHENGLASKRADGTSHLTKAYINAKSAGHLGHLTNACWGVGMVSRIGEQYVDAAHSDARLENVSEIRILRPIKGAGIA